MPLFSPTEWSKKNVMAVQDYSLLAWRSLANLFSQPRYMADTLQQADLIGVGSLPIVVLTGFFTGAVLALQSANSLARFGALSFTGQLVSLSTLLENLHRGEYERIIVVGHSLGSILAYDLISYFWAARLILVRLSRALQSFRYCKILKRRLPSLRKLRRDPSDPRQ